MAAKASRTDPAKIPDDIAKLSFEAALKELEGIVSQLEEGAVDLEKSIAIYERGTLLKQHCEAKLRDAEARIEKIRIGPDGKATGAGPASFD
jgi:exodeoxyribonuclease VII small subunit